MFLPWLRRTALLALGLLLTMPDLATAGNLVNMPVEEYAARRQKLRAALGAEKAMAVLIGNTEEETGDLRNGFLQEPNFYYLTGWNEPGAMLLLTANTEILFLPTPTEKRNRYTGKKLSPDDPSAVKRTGFTVVMPAERFEVTLFQNLESAEKVYSLLQFARAPRLKRLLGPRKIENLAKLLFPLRQVKSPLELAAMRNSVDATVAAHLAAWQRSRAGLYEYQIGATMLGTYLERGCQRDAYPPIVGSGPNSVILHYFGRQRRMDAGEVLLLDVGAECDMYAADLTRTIPVGGKFSARQREIYDIVLGAQKAAIAAIKPGMTLSKTGENSLYKIAYDYINTHGQSLTGEPLGKYFTHGLGHHIGLEVHDPSNPEDPLKPGNVITIEPGIYIPEENIGIRIEDMVLVTETGGEVISRALPREAIEIEARMKEAQQPKEGAGNKADKSSRVN